MNKLTCDTPAPVDHLAGLLDDLLELFHDLLVDDVVARAGDDDAAQLVDQQGVVSVVAGGGGVEPLEEELEHRLRVVLGLAKQHGDVAQGWIKRGKM